MKKISSFFNWGNWSWPKRFAYFAAISFILALFFLCLGCVCGDIDFAMGSFHDIMATLMRMGPAGVGSAWALALGAIGTLVVVYKIFKHDQKGYFLVLALGVLEGLILPFVIGFAGSLNGVNPEIVSKNPSAAIALMMISASLIVISTILVFIGAFFFDAGKEKKPLREKLPPMVRLVAAKQLHLSDEEKNVQIDMLRYRGNSLATTLGYIALLAQVVAFCTVYSTVSISASYNVTIFGYTNAGVWTGVDIFVNIIFLLFVFLTISRMKVYDRNWGIVSIVIGAFELIRLFLFPLALWNANTATTTVISSPVFTIQIVCYVMAGALLIVAGALTIWLSNILNKYLNAIKSGEESK